MLQTLWGDVQEFNPQPIIFFSHDTHQVTAELDILSNPRARNVLRIGMQSSEEFWPEGAYHYRYEREIKDTGLQLRGGDSQRIYGCLWRERHVAQGLFQCIFD